MRATIPSEVEGRLRVDESEFRIVDLAKVPGASGVLARAPRTRRILAENVARHASGPEDLARAGRVLGAEPRGPGEPVAFYPERILLQDFTGIPVIVDLTAIRSETQRRGVDPESVNPRIPVDLVVDHSVQVDSFGRPDSITVNLDREYERNGERYRLLRWAQAAFRKTRIVPPGNGIVHQVNLEYLATVATTLEADGAPVLVPDTLLGTDSHTPMVNGVGVLGWGVGGIEAEAALLGEPYMLGPPVVVGLRLTGRLPQGSTATDLVLVVTRMLREHGVVDKFVEFCGPGVAALSVPDRATVSNMSPEYGATAALFPVDEATIVYLRGTGRSDDLCRRVEQYARRLGLWSEPDEPPLEFDEMIELDLGSIAPTVSGPKNPEESVALDATPESFRRAAHSYRAAHPAPTGVTNGGDPHVTDGTVVIAAITSCTNTSNPSVMLGAGLIARRAVALGLRPPTYVKTSMAPGSKVVTEYLRRAGLLAPLEALGFSVVGYGCTTCIGNSGPLPGPVEAAIRSHDLYVAAVLSGNRNFEARIHNLVRANYLMSPMLVVVYALAGRVDLDLTREPVATTPSGAPVYLRDLWPPLSEIQALQGAALDPELFRTKYDAVTVGDAHWEALSVPKGLQYPWDERSTYLREPPYFSLPPVVPAPDGTLVDHARVLAVLGDQVTTDHISPAGEIPYDSPAGEYLLGHGVPVPAFNTYGSRRGNHEVMIRGTFANVRLQNALAGGKEGGFTTHQPSGDLMTIFGAAERYRAEGTPLLVLAGASYGQGSSRDWAAKGPRLLGVRAVLAESFERIHRSNLVGMGVMPLTYRPGESARSLGLTGREEFTVRGPAGGGLAVRGEFEVRATAPAGTETSFRARGRLDSETEIAYFRDGGLLPYVVQRMTAG